MTPGEFRAKLEELTALPTGTEWVEFKRNDRGPPMYAEMGEYLSAIANALALLRRDRGYIAWGIDDQTHAWCGTDFCPRQAKMGNEELENWLTRNLHPQVRFAIHEADFDGKHFVLIEVSAATHTPVRFSGEEYIRVGSIKKRLKDHPEKERQLWSVLTFPDWSVEVCDGASVDDLDPQAVAFARQEFKKKHPPLAADVDRWDDLTLLNKAKVCRGGKLTRAAILLLGRSEAEHLIAPAIGRITWVLHDADKMAKDYQHFGPPLLLAVDQVFAKVRNLTYRYLPSDTLFPTELSQYDTWVLRETLHNCIAHQDYTLGGRINVVEEPESLLFTNVGDFLPGSVEEVIRRDAPLDVYRNRFLAEAMVQLNMIDTIGSGIKRMFTTQRERNFPLPDYDLSEPGRIKVRIIGKVIDEKYTRMLSARPDLDLSDVIALDKVQKGRRLTNDEFKSLKSKRLVEGRRSNLFVSAEVAAATDTKAEYIKRRGFDKEHYKKMVIAYLEKFGEARRDELDKLLLEKLSDALTHPQKREFIRNLLQGLRREGSIESHGATRWATWRLRRPPQNDED